MTDLAIDVLRILRTFGPCSNADVGRRLGVDSSKTYRQLQLLVDADYAEHRKLQAWDITPKGREVFEQQPNRPLGLFPATDSPETKGVAR